MTQRDTFKTRRDFLRASGALSLAMLLPDEARSQAIDVPLERISNGPWSHQRSAMWPKAPLASQPFHALPTGAIKPAGWLRRQL